MTDPDFADATYIEPITPEIVEKIIEKERPDARCSHDGRPDRAQHRDGSFQGGTLDKNGVEMIGANARGDRKGEDRLKFREAMFKIGLEIALSAWPHRWRRRGGAGTRSLADDHPPGFTLGGTGGGIAYNREEFDAIVDAGLEPSPTSEILIEESVLGWKEYEIEVMRDQPTTASSSARSRISTRWGCIQATPSRLPRPDADGQGISTHARCAHRGAPRNRVETGGSNVQFAVNPKTDGMVVIEMNPRVSRSSALASKATGFPIAKIAAKLAVGYTLDEIGNDITAGDPGELRADHRLRRGENSALRIREIPGGGADAEDPDEIGGRSDGDRADLRGDPSEGAPRARDRARPAWTASYALENADPAEIELRRLTGSHSTGCWSPPKRFARGSRSSVINSDRRLRSVVSPRGWRRSFARRNRCRVRWPAERYARHAAAESDGLFRRPARRSSRSARRTSSARPAKRWRRGAARRGPQRDPGDDRRLSPKPEVRARTACGLGVLGWCSSASTAARPSSMRRPPTSIRPTRAEISSAGTSRRAGRRGRRVGPAQGDDPRRRAEPHRAGDRVRLLLLPRRFRARPGRAPASK